MIVILNPEVEVIAATQFLGSHSFQIPRDGTFSDKVCAFAAKVCYDSNGADGRPNQENQRAILEHRHGSVLEHFSISMYITGITRAVSLEINRHRTFAISQRSTRYVKEEAAGIVLEPYYANLFNKHKFFWNVFTERWVPNPWVQGQPDTAENIREIRVLRDFLNSCQQQLQDYNKQVESLIELNPNNLSGFDLRKWARGKARNILPHALETRAVYTANLRAWRWFIEARSNRHAEPEIRRLADVVMRQLVRIAPLHFEDFTINDVVDGLNEWVPKYSKV